MGHLKQLAIKNLLKKANPDRVLIQETKREGELYNFNHKIAR